MRYFYKLLYKYYNFYIQNNQNIIEINPQNDFLQEHFQNNYTAVNSIYDFEKINKRANTVVGGTNSNYDYVILNGNLQYERDIQKFLESLHEAVTTKTRIIISYYSSLWKPIFILVTKLKIRKKTPEQNWISHEDINNLLLLAGFELIRRDSRVLFPIYIPLLSDFINRFIAPLPFFRLFTMINIVLARPLYKKAFAQEPSVSVIIPARNEAGNIEKAINRIPKMGGHDEIIFVEGNSTDNTWEVIQQAKEKYGNKRNIKISQQSGRGKGDAVRKGFSLAQNEIFMILDADLTVPPEELPKFYKAITSNKGEFINGSRLIYPIENDAMRFFNILGNKFFAIAFSFILGQKFKDTLCGTKVLSSQNYIKLVANRAYFGDFDPFGDFDLLFGASRMGLKIIEIPITYKERTYGDTNISRWKHGFILLRMLLFATNKIKFI
jgi:hypothetical protein